MSKKTLRLVAWKVSGNSLLIQGCQSHLPVLSPVLEAKDQVQTQIMTRPGENRLAGDLGKEIDPFQYSVNFILHILAKSFDLGCKYRSINSYRSAISAYHCYVEGKPVGQHKQVCVLRGVFTKKPPQPRYTFAWVVQVVLDFVKNNWGNSNSLSDWDLTF